MQNLEWKHYEKLEWRLRQTVQAKKGPRNVHALGFDVRCQIQDQRRDVASCDEKDQDYISGLGPFGFVPTLLFIFWHIQWSRGEEIVRNEEKQTTFL